jgi:hypothetical protein
MIRRALLLLLLAVGISARVGHAAEKDLSLFIDPDGTTYLENRTGAPPLLRWVSDHHRAFW